MVDAPKVSISLWACVSLVAIAAAGVQTSRLSAARADLADEKAAASAQRAQYAEAAASAGQAYRAEEQRRTQAQQEIAHVAELSRTRTAADRHAADGAAGRLQQRFEALATASCRQPAGDSPVTGASPPASGAGDLLADVQRRLATAAGQFAAVADGARIAGHACEQSYESLTVPQPALR